MTPKKTKEAIKELEEMKLIVNTGKGYAITPKGDEEVERFSKTNPNMIVLTFLQHMFNEGQLAWMKSDGRIAHQSEENNP